MTRTLGGSRQGRQGARVRLLAHAGVVTLAFIGVLEFLLRVFGVAALVSPTPLLHAIDSVSALPYMQARPDVLWTPSPGYRGSIHGQPVSINSLGCRGPEPAPREPGRLRIACFGDSITFGDGVLDSETYPASLGRELPGVDVLNAGVDGYSSQQVLARVRRLAPSTQPDIATFLVGWNDRVERPATDRTYARRIGAIMAAEGPFGSLRLFTALEGFYLASVRSAEARRAPVARVSPAQYRENLLSLAQECRARGITPVFIELPHRSPASAADLASPYPAALRQAAWAAGVHFVDGGTLTAAAGLDNERYFVDALHLNPEGHALLAGQLAKALVEMGVGRPQ